MIIIMCFSVLMAFSETCGSSFPTDGARLPTTTLIYGFSGGKKNIKFY